MLNDSETKQLEPQVNHASTLSIISAGTLITARQLPSLLPLLMVTSLGISLAFWGLSVLLKTLPEHARFRTIFRLHYEMCLLTAMVYIVARDYAVVWLAFMLLSTLSFTGSIAYCIAQRKHLLVQHVFALWTIFLALPWSELDKFLRPK